MRTLRRREFFHSKKGVIEFSYLEDPKGLKEFLEELDETTWKYWYRFGKDPHSTYSNILLSIDKVLFTVGKLKKKIVSLAYLDKIDKDKRICRFGIVVHPAFRGLKIGTSHTKFILKVAKDLNLEKVLLSVDTKNEPAFKLYKKLGWKIVKFFEDNPTRCEMELNLKEEENSLFSFENRINYYLSTTHFKLSKLNWNFLHSYKPWAIDPVRPEWVDKILKKYPKVIK